MQETSRAHGAGRAVPPARGDYIRASSISRALDVVGDRWVLMILQQAFFGVRRFDEFQRRLGIARSTLTSRLNHLVGHEVLTRRPYQDNPPRYDYRLTDKGWDLFPTGLMARGWQQRWTDVAELRPVELVHLDCGRPTEPWLACQHCMREVNARETRYEDGPGAGWVRRGAKRRRRPSAELVMPSNSTMSAELLELLGDRWTPQVASMGFFRINRFEDMCDSLQLATNILSDRLRRLVALGIYRTELYQERPPRLQYRLTEKGLAFFPLLVELMHWGDRWCASPEGPPLLLFHKSCGEPLETALICSRCGSRVGLGNIRMRKVRGSDSASS
jgi:DNA-binding HxlR family transcriptional regulator